MAFDLSTATDDPVQPVFIDGSLSNDVPLMDGEGFDLSTATDDPPEQSLPEQQAPAQELPQGSYYENIQDAVNAVTSSALGSAGAGIAGTATALTSGLDEGVNTAKDIQQTMDEFGKPQTQGGEELLGAMSKAGEFLTNELRQTAAGIWYFGDRALGSTVEESEKARDEIAQKGPFNVAGDYMADKFGPEAGTIVKMLPEILATGAVSRNIIKTPTKYESDIINRIKGGDTNGELAKYKVSDKGRLLIDSESIDAMDAGLDAGFVQNLKALPAPEGIGVLSPTKSGRKSPEINPTREYMMDMLEIKKRGANDGFYADSNRATDVIGDRGLARLNYIKDVNRKAGKAIDKEANKLKDIEIDFSQPVANFEQGLVDMGINRNPKTGSYDFKGSDIEGLTGLESVIERVINRMSSGEPGKMPSAYDVHRLKRYLDKNIGYGKQIEGLDADVEHLLRQLRVDLDDTLDNKFPAYDAANTGYADTIGLIKEMKSLAGSKVDLTGKSANRAIGQTLRKSLSNYQSGSRVKQLMSDMDDISRKHGASFDDDLQMLISFDNNLDRIFGASASGGFQAGIEAGVGNAVRDAFDGKSYKRKAADYVIGKLSPDKESAFDVIGRAVSGKENPWRN